MKKTSTEGRERTTAYIDKEDIKELKKMAIDRGTSMADLLNQAIKRFLDKERRTAYCFVPKQENPMGEFFKDLKSREVENFKILRDREKGK